MDEVNYEGVGMKAEFKFCINEEVKTVFGDRGFVQMACIDDEKQIKYFVQRSQESQWFKQNQLKSAEPLDSTGKEKPEPEIMK